MPFKNTRLGHRGVAVAMMIVAVGASAALRVMMAPFLGTNVPFVTFYPAVAWISWRYGSSLGLATIAISGLTAVYLFLPELGSWQTESAGLVALSMFGVTSLFLWWIVGSLQRAHLRALTAGELLTATLSSIGDGVICTDTQGNITRMNTVAERLTGWRSAEAIGRPMPDVLPVVNEQTRSVVPNLALSVMRKDSFNNRVGKLRLIPRDGNELVIADSAAAIERDGTVLGAVIVFRDVTDECRRAQEACRTLETLNSLVSSAPVGIAIFDRDTKFLQINKVLADMNGLPVAMHIGKTLAEVAPDLRDQAVPLLEQVFRTNQTISNHLIEGETPSAPGVRRYWREGWFPIPGPDGKPTSVGVIVQEITDERKAEEALREADRRKDEFLATLAHELRNPLAPIKYALDLLKQDGGQVDQRQYAIATMGRQVDHMVRLIDDLLDISRITRKKLKLRREVIDLCSVLNQAVEACRPHCAAVGHELAVTVDRASIAINADPIRFAQILSNLLNNACKYTPPGGHIHVSVSCDQQHVTVCIKDDGIGITEDVLPHVFDMFAQADTALERSQGGLGIGLSLVKWLVEMHDGTVAVSSLGVNQGSEFSITVPLAAGNAICAESARREPASITCGLRYLVVDDSPDIANTLALLLRLHGNETLIASDGVDAVEKASSFDPHVVLLDIGLPRLNGYDACRQIRQSSTSLQPVIVAMTGWGQEEDRKKSESAGFDGHLVKPVDQNVLQTLLTSLLLNRPPTATSEHSDTQP